MNQPAPVQNHLVFAIVSTVIATIVTMLSCCCLPLGLAPGIPAIIFANKANSLLAAGDEAGARIAADKAKMWSWVTAGLAICFAILFGVSLLARSMGWIDSVDLKQLIEEAQKNQ